MFSPFRDFLNPGWVGSLISALGLITCVLFYLLSRRRSILVYRTKGVRLLGHAQAKLPLGVLVHYHGRDIPRLTRSVIVIWNAGQLTVNGSDITSMEPLRIHVGEGAEILSASVVKPSRPVILATCAMESENKTSATLRFDFLDPGDGFVVEILHTGEEKHPIINGIIKGIPTGLKNLGRVFSPSSPAWLPLFGSWRALAGLIIFTGLSAIALGIVDPHFVNLLPGSKPEEVAASLIIAGMLYLALGSLALWSLRRRYPARLQTDELE